MAMTFKFKRGANVVVTMRNGNTIQGKVKDDQVNFCTYKDQYDVEYSQNGKSLILIGVPESAITLA